MWLAILLILASTLLLLIVKYYKNKHSYWSDRHVPTPQYLFFVGNIWEQFTYRKNLGMIITDAYKSSQFQGYNYFGFYTSTTPTIIMRSVELIKNVLVNDFHSFQQNEIDISNVDGVDPMSGKNAFIQSGEKWKTIRSEITPSLTTSKVKLMLPLLKQTSEKLVQYLNSKSTCCDAFDAKELATRITSENVASCVFGIQGGSFNNNNPAKEQFYLMADRLLNSSSTWDHFKNFLFYLLPFLGKYFDSKAKLKDATRFLSDVVEQSLTHRETNNLQRNDLLQGMQELRKKINEEKTFGLEDILGHAAAFLIDGIETSANVLSHALYELGADGFLQEEIRQEIAGFPELTYEDIQEMKLLDSFFNEVLRLHPPFFFMTKRVTRPYNLGAMHEDGTGPQITLEVGTPVIIPLYAIHVDEKYHHDAQIFKIERFLDGNRKNIEKYTYLPFGEGPRICLGMKFGVLQVKLALITIIQHFFISVNGKTAATLEIDPTVFVNYPKGGYWIDFKRIK